jgi:hypothetical protein
MFPPGLASKLGISLIPVPAVQSNSNKLRRDSLLSDLCVERLTPKIFQRYDYAYKGCTTYYQSLQNKECNGGERAPGSPKRDEAGRGSGKTAGNWLILCLGNC